MAAERVLLFGGTTEGRRLAEFLAGRGMDFTLSVATDYGKEAAEGVPAGRVQSARLTEDQMRLMFRDYSLVIDATHPYAQEVTRNIKSACESCNVLYMRVQRQAAQLDDDENVRYFENNKSAVEFLNLTDAPVFLATGSRDAADFTQIRDFDKRVFIRMLPIAEALRECVDLGYKSSNIICMQGSFSKELNMELLTMTGAKYLVTKESGEIGGFLNKIRAAQALGVVPVVISRPPGESGYSLEQAVEILKRRFVKSVSKRFPVFLDLSGRLAVVIGGGKVAERRVNVLLDFTETVAVISPDVTDGLKVLADEKKIKWSRRAYQKGDLEAAFLCVAATDQRRVNHEAAKEAKERGIYCSVADSKEESSFWFPGIVQEENLIVGIVSDNGDHKRVKRGMQLIKEVLSDEA